MNNFAMLAGRIVMAAIFIPAGWGKIAGYAGTASYMDSQGIPGILLPLVIITELGGGLALLLGAYTRFAGLALAGFCFLAAILFHGDFGMMFWKDCAIGGGLLYVYAAGGGAYSLDAKTLKRRRPQPGDKWFLDEVFVRIRGKLHYLWRAVDQHGNVLDGRWTSYCSSSA